MFGGDKSLEETEAPPPQATHRLAFGVAREGGLKPVEGLLIGKLLTVQNMEQLLGKRANAPFRIEKGRGGIWREEGESPAVEALYLSLAARPIIWRRMPARGGDSL